MTACDGFWPRRRPTRPSRAGGNARCAMPRRGGAEDPADDGVAEEAHPPRSAAMPATIARTPPVRHRDTDVNTDPFLSLCPPNYPPGMTWSRLVQMAAESAAVAYTRMRARDEVATVLMVITVTVLDVQRFVIMAVSSKVQYRTYFAPLPCPVVY